MNEFNDKNIAVDNIEQVTDIEFSDKLDKIISESSTLVKSLLNSYCRGVELTLWNQRDLIDTLDKISDLAEEYRISDEVLKENLIVKLRTLRLASY